jgi:hypothetical protein
MRFDFRTTSDINADRVALFSPAARLHETKGAGAPSRQRGRHPSVRLLDAVMRLAGEHGELISHAERPWASATFSGTRHTITMTFSGAEGVEAAEHFMEALPDHEFTIPAQLVADAAVVEVTHITQPMPRIVLEADLLLLADI